MNYMDETIVKAYLNQNESDYHPDPGPNPPGRDKLTLRERLLLRLSDFLINSGRNLRKSVCPRVCTPSHLSYGKR